MYQINENVMVWFFAGWNTSVMKGIKFTHFHSNFLFNFIS